MPYPLAQLLPNPQLEWWFAMMEGESYLSRRIILKKMRDAGKIYLPRFLYRFQSLRRVPDRQANQAVFQAESMRRLRVPLVDSLLALRSPEEFNDPFDMRARIVVGGTHEQKVARYRSLFEQHNTQGAAGEREAFVERMLAGPNEELLARVATSLDNNRRAYGVVCFSAGEDPARDVLMWSHYGASHTGVCLQYDPARDVRVLSHAVSVDYSAEYPVIDWIVGFQDSIRNSLLRKHPRWRSEDEHRIVFPNEAGKYLPFRAEALTAVILGCRADEDVLTTVRELLAERAGRGLPRVRMYQAQQNPDRYELDIRPAPVPSIIANTVTNVD